MGGVVSPRISFWIALAIGRTRVGRGRMALAQGRRSAHRTQAQQDAGDARVEPIATDTQQLRYGTSLRHIDGSREEIVILLANRSVSVCERTPNPSRLERIGQTEAVDSVKSRGTE